MMAETGYDPRYASVTCSTCHRLWQRIDYGGALHTLTCGYPLPAQVEPQPGRALTPEAWRAFDLAGGAARVPHDALPPEARS